MSTSNKSVNVKIEQHYTITYPNGVVGDEVHYSYDEAVAAHRQQGVEVVTANLVVTVL